MKKLLLLIAITFFGLTSIQAQEGAKLGVNVGLPIGDFADFTTVSIGVDAAYLFEVSDAFYAGIATGYISAFTEDIEFLGVTVELENVQFLPIAAAARYYASEEFYLGADVGYAVSLNDGGEGGVYYRPKAGYNVTENIGLNLSYMGVALDGTSYSSINLGFEFSL